MTVTERFQAAGTLGLQLDEETPPSKLDAVDLASNGFGHIIITPTRVDHRALSAADLMSIARYTGMLRKQRNQFELGGASLAVWLGDEDKKGDIIETALTKASGTFVQWVTDIKPGSLTAGTYTAIAGALSHTFQWVSRREALDYVCDYFGGEWRINSDGTLDAGAQGDLFVTDPTVIVQPNSGGRDQNVTGINAQFDVDRDLEDYTTRVVVLGESGNGSVDISPAPDFKDLNGNTVVWTRVVESPTTEAGNEDAIAQAQLNRFSSMRRAVELRSDRYDLAGDFAVGDTIWVYDPQRWLVDTANEVPYRGQVIHPLKLRVRGHTWPVQSGMGVYVRAPDASGTITDLTDWVLFESGESTVEVGATARSINS